MAEKIVPPAQENWEHIVKNQLPVTVLYFGSRKLKIDGDSVFQGQLRVIESGYQVDGAVALAGRAGFTSVQFPDNMVLEVEVAGHPLWRVNPKYIDEVLDMGFAIVVRLADYYPFGVTVETVENGMLKITNGVCCNA